MTDVHLQIRRNSSALWAASDPVLRAGELGWDTTLDQLKIGNGTDAWSDLPFYGALGTGTLLLEPTQDETDVDPDTPLKTIVYRQAEPATVWDFRNGSMPSGWSTRGVSTPSFGSNGATFSPAAGQGLVHAVPGTAGTAWTVEALIHSGNASGVMQGLMTTDAGGGGRCVFPYSSPSGFLSAFCSAWQYNSFTTADSVNAWPHRLRIRRAASSYYTSVSTDGGVTWTTERAGTAADATEFSVGSLYAGATAMTLSTVTFTPGGTTGGLLGWWDGSTIVGF